ncbi:MAG TPA: C39 family peptidase [Anaerolineales bacterium]|nr:C39 family peptidase [Anaerolineales bacterium]
MLTAPRRSTAMRKARRRWWLLIPLALIACGGLGAWVYNLPSFQERFGWRISEARAAVFYALFPPEESVFTPNPTLAAMVQQTLSAFTPTPTTTPSPGPTAPPSPTPTSTIVPTPVPEHVELHGTRHEYQKYNNCGPATLSMALSYWGWEGDQRPIAAYTKPNPRDKNVMPYELEAFVDNQTELRALVRVGGDLDRLKSLIAAGFPVMVEKGFEGPGFDGWMGHYELLTGYDDGRGRFIAQDSYIGSDLPIPYAELESYWRAFNFTYIILYPPDRESDVLALLGADADEKTNIVAAAQKASDDIFALEGRDQLFAWFNRGTNLVDEQDYAGAAAAYDEAFRIDAELAILDPETRPWRILWYQTGPYWAYFYSGRYYDVINLATQTLGNMSEPILEESYYWRGLARQAIGDADGAIADFRTALTYHDGFEPALYQLRLLGLDG